MSKGTNMQDTVLNLLRTQKIPVTVFLTNGFQQRGNVISYDGYTVLLINEGRQYLIYKHAISTIVPFKNISLQENMEV